tara:strand:- start:309 stop:518 length:210 start_codon:yes stop_codon:yes gene_type:complete
VSTQKQKLVTINKVKIMSKNTKGKAAKDWSLSLGTYPGILFGMRTYHGDTHSQTVFYLPFIDLAYEVER